MITCKDLHKIIWRAVRFDCESNLTELTKNGVYIMFEKGETAYDGDRIVRIGINKQQDTLKTRLNNHYNGTNRKSVFRRHIATALTNKQNSPATNQDITKYIKDNITFAVIEVQDQNKRKELESRLVATVAQDSNCKPSNNWLGKFCKADKIKNGNLWNVQGLKAEPLNKEYLQLIYDGIVLNGDISADFKKVLAD